MREGEQWLSDRVLDSRLRGSRVEPHWRHCVMSLSKTHLSMLSKDSTRECSGSVVECLTRDRGAAGSRLTGITALWSLSKTHLS